MRGRCNNPYRSDCHLYGGRRIRCDLTFEEFSPKSAPDRPHSIIWYFKDKNGHHAKGNINLVPLGEWRRGKPLSAELRLEYQQTKATYKRTGKRKGTSRFIGVCWYNSDGFWHAQNRGRWSGQSLGRYANEEKRRTLFST